MSPPPKQRKPAGLSPRELADAARLAEHVATIFESRSLFTLEEAAAVLGVSTGTITGLKKDRLLRVVRVGGSDRVTKPALLAYLASLEPKGD